MEDKFADSHFFAAPLFYPFDSNFFKIVSTLRRNVIDQIEEPSVESRVTVRDVVSFRHIQYLLFLCRAFLLPAVYTNSGAQLEDAGHVPEKKGDSHLLHRVPDTLAPPPFTWPHPPDGTSSSFTICRPTPSVVQN